MVDLMIELLETEISEPDYIPTARGREIINEIADYAEGTELFAAKGSLGTYMQGWSYTALVAHMLDRCENAPTAFHLSASVILLMPFVRRRFMELEVTA
jgi:hypothetical protein